MPVVSQRVAVVLRSAAYRLVIYLLAAPYALLLPLMPLSPRKAVKAVFDSYLSVCVWVLKVVCGLDYEVRGRENLPDCPVLFAAKRQSTWELFVYPILLGDPAFLVRRSLLRIPVAGWIIRSLRHIVIDRPSTPIGVVEMLRTAKQRIAEGRSVVVFPEGTRMHADLNAQPVYKSGVVALYRALERPCVPIAVNSGVFWPRKSLLRYPGKITVEILPAIPPGLPTTEFMQRLVDSIEGATHRLIRAAEGNAAQDRGG